MTTKTLESPAESRAEKLPLANALRRMADWIDAHPGVEDELMEAEVGKNQRPRVSLYSVAVLHAAFPGREAKVTQYKQSEITSLEVDGILFEAWESGRDVSSLPTTVVLGAEQGERLDAARSSGEFFEECKR